MLLPYGSRRAARLRPQANEQAIKRVYNEVGLRKAMGEVAAALTFGQVGYPRHEILVSADIALSSPIEFTVGDGIGDLVIRCEGTARILPAEAMDYLFFGSGLESRRFILRECNIGNAEDPLANHVFGTDSNQIVTVERCRISTLVGLCYAATSAPTLQYSQIVNNYIDSPSGWELLTTMGMRLSSVHGNRATALWNITYGTVASIYNNIAGNFMRGGAITTTGSTGNSAIVGNTQVTVTGVGSDSIAGNT